jgi:hypothetical protein
MLYDGMIMEVNEMGGAYERDSHWHIKMPMATMYITGDGLGSSRDTITAVGKVGKEEEAIVCYYE